jgi:hypothetical protein
MKHSFILDENVIAQTKNLSLAKQTLQLVTLMKTNCHKIVLDRNLNKKLDSWLSRRDKQLANFFPMGPIFIRDLLADSRKKQWVSTQFAAKERSFIHDPDDWYLVDLAVSCKNVHFVSTGDNATRENFNRSEFKAMGIDGITVAEAINLARDS